MEDRNAYAGGQNLRALLQLPKQDTPDHRVLLASALIRQEKFRDALVPLSSAIEEARSAGEQPSENWLSMLAAAYYSLEEHEAMRAVVRELAEIYPSEQYLMNLAALHGQLGDRQQQLALVEAMLDDGRITRGTYLKMLASLYLAENLPYKAATLLEAAISEGRIKADVQTLEQISQAWYLASEFDRAVEPLSRAAAKAAAEQESGELYLRLAGLHMDAYHWMEADTAAALAIETGGLKREGEAWLMRGMANAQLERFRRCRESVRMGEKIRYGPKACGPVADLRRQRAEDEIRPEPLRVLQVATRLLNRHRYGTLCLLGIGLYGFVLSLTGCKEAWALAFSVESSGSFVQSILDASLATPFTSLLSGIIITSLIQSSSATIALVVATVAAGAISVGESVFVLMGANIGTTITNTIVALAHGHKRAEYLLTEPTTGVLISFVTLMHPRSWSSAPWSGSVDRSNLEGQLHSETQQGACHQSDIVRRRYALRMIHAVVGRAGNEIPARFLQPPELVACSQIQTDDAGRIWNGDRQVCLTGERRTLSKAPARFSAEGGSSDPSGFLVASSLLLPTR